MTRKRHFLVAALVGFLSVSAPPVAAVSQDAAFLLTRMALDLRVDYGRGTIGGTATLRFRNASDRPEVRVPLLLNRLMTVSRVTGVRGVDLSFDQRIVVFEDDPIRQVNAIVVTPGHPLAPGDSLTIVLHYGGILVGYTETGSVYIKDRVNRDFTILREDAYAFPMLGVPSLASNRRAPREPFMFAARVTVPADLVVAMGGEAQERTTRDSLTTWNYSSVDPVPFLNITIAPYRQLDQPGARIFYFPADSSGARMVARAVEGAVGRYASWYGPVGREPRLVVMEIPEGFGSQASLTAGILQTADAFREAAQLPQLYHEISHVWNVPDLDRPSARWNEGLASFLQWRMAAELDGWADWDAQANRTTQFLMRRCSASVRCDATPFAAYGSAGLTDRSYSVGMLMFYTLFRVLGPDAFDRAYRNFFQEHRATGATIADLVAAFRGASPLSERIFDDWLFSTRWYSRLASGESLGHMIDGYSP